MDRIGTSLPVHLGNYKGLPLVLTLSPVETCFHKAHMNLCGVFILGVIIKVLFCFFGQ